MSPKYSSPIKQNDKKNTNKIIGITIIVIVILIIIAAIVGIFIYYNNNNDSDDTNSSDGSDPTYSIPPSAIDKITTAGNTAGSDSPPSTPPAPTPPPTNRGLWIRSGGDLYADGLDKDDSYAYCQKYGSDPATTSDVVKAGTEGGLNFCSGGWLADSNGVPTAGYYMQEKIDGCGNTIGYVPFQVQNDSQLLSTYCTGPIPTDPKPYYSFAFDD